MKNYKFHVHGMHCNSCVVLTENELQNHSLVEKVVANLNTCCVEVVGDFQNRSEQEVAGELSRLVESYGYKISTEKEVKKTKWSDFRIAVPIALGFMVLFVLLQKLGIVNLISGGEVGYGTAFLVGLVASVSTCMAVVGSLVLSVSANFAKEGDRVRPQVLFHLGRLISFFVLGGVIGLLGSAFTFGNVGTFILTFLVAIVMLILGLNLLDIFPWAKRIQPTLPKFISNHLLRFKMLNSTLTPIILGVATFFLPCGFTQSMQIYSLSTGGFIGGAMTMFVFALGTLPVLALLSFSSLGIKDLSKSGVFFKTAGLVVILFAIFNLINSFVMIGLIPPIFNL